MLLLMTANRRQSFERRTKKHNEHDQCIYCVIGSYSKIFFEQLQTELECTFKTMYSRVKDICIERKMMKFRHIINIKCI